MSERHRITYPARFKPSVGNTIPSAASKSIVLMEMHGSSRRRTLFLRSWASLDRRLQAGLLQVRPRMANYEAKHAIEKLRTAFVEGLARGRHIDALINARAVCDEIIRVARS